ncbi:MAG: DUF502 domain-containing protein [Thermoguttaceae bacterium]|nr:DUF502 domain-containing protein [Thermoguttaceae bacterium]
MSFLKKLFRYLLTGTFFLLPFAITVGALAWLGRFIAKYLGPQTLIGKGLSNIGFFSFQTDYPLLSYVIGLLIVLAIIVAIGWIIERRWVKTIVDFINELIKKIPAIGTIYSSTQQLVKMFDNSSAVKKMTPVFCRFGSTLILTLMPTSDKFVIEGKTFCSVIIPTAPFPVGGAVLMVPEEDIVPSNMKLDQFLSYYGTMGVNGKEFIQILKESEFNDSENKE